MLSKLNVGCGKDYREGFVNIDGSKSLNKVDIALDLNHDRLIDHFKNESISYILANDIVEHHFHWEAVDLLDQFYDLLCREGICEIRVPDCSWIIESKKYDIETKLTLLFGGQDISQGIDDDMDLSRKQYPHYFCHKYGWTMERMKKELAAVGFASIKQWREGSNFISLATK